MVRVYALTGALQTKWSMLYQDLGFGNTIYYIKKYTLELEQRSLMSVQIIVIPKPMAKLSFHLTIWTES